MDSTMKVLTDIVHQIYYMGPWRGRGEDEEIVDKGNNDMPTPHPARSGFPYVLSFMLG